MTEHSSQKMNRYIYLCSTENIYFLQNINELMDQQSVDGMRPKLITSPYIKEGVLERYDMETKTMATIDNPLKHKFQLWKQD